ncbi:MAG: Uma2 family endonuclease [Chloroflexota bacterium]
MAELLHEKPQAKLEPIEPDISHIITEDEEPVDNLPSAKQQRLLVEPLYSSNHLPEPYLADANVGIFSAINMPPIVPDVFVSLDVQLAGDWWQKRHRSYFIWEFGKPPDVVLEIVSNKEGGEAERKLNAYARMRVDYYVIYDPQLQIQSEPLRVYELNAGQYLLRPDTILPRVELGLILWQGAFEGKEEQWLRWATIEDELLLTGSERAEEERQRAEEERQRAEEERQRAEEERQRAEEERQRAEEERQRADEAKQEAEHERQRANALAAKLLALGVDPDTDT